MLIAPLVPPAKHGGRRREVDEREIVDGIMSIFRTRRSASVDDANLLKY